MQRLIIICAVLLCGSFHLSSAVAQKGLAQQPAVPVRQTAEIVPGQSLAEAKAILQHHKMEFGDRTYQTTGANEYKHISCTLNPEHSDACLTYRAGTDKIAGLSVCFRPQSQPGRLYHTWVNVRKITLHADGSYSLQFEPPVAK